MRKWRADIGDVVLQVTRRATEPRDEQESRSSSELKAPDAHVLGLANSWTESNLRAGSPLSVILKKRIRESVEEAVLDIVLPSSPSPSPSPSPRSTGCEYKPDTCMQTPVAGTGFKYLDTYLPTYLPIRK